MSCKYHLPNLGGCVGMLRKWMPSAGPPLSNPVTTRRCHMTAVTAIFMACAIEIQYSGPWKAWGLISAVILWILSSYPIPSIGLVY